MKRTIDLLIAGTALVLLFPIMAGIGFIIRMKLGSPILFIQKRPGLNGQPFYLYKFRTMKNEKDSQGHNLPDEVRITAIGTFLRKYSLDELPQLVNVLKGDLSLVGPRPLLMEYLPLYTEEQFKRHYVKPGITGWAQVNGRNALTWEEKFKLDIWYVENQSLSLDIKIMWLTFKKLIKTEDVNGVGHVTMSRFEGTKGKELG